MDHPFYGWWQHIIFAILIAVLVTVAAWYSWWWLLAVLFFFVVWDLWFVTSDALHDRSNLEVIQAITDAKTTLSWFIFLYGAIVAYVITNNKVADLVKLCESAGVPLLFPILPLLIASFASIFVPIKRDHLQTTLPQQPSPALKSMMVFTVFLQKCVIVSFVYCLLALGFSLYRNSPIP